MLGHRLRRWPSIDPTLGKCIVFAGVVLSADRFKDCAARPVYIVSCTFQIKSNTTNETHKMVSDRQIDIWRMLILLSKFPGFEAGNCVSDSSFKWLKNRNTVNLVIISRFYFREKDKFANSRMSRKLLL